MVSVSGDHQLVRRIALGVRVSGQYGYANRFFQLARQSHRPPARSTVRVREGADGQIEIAYRDRRIQWHEIAGDTVPAKQARTPQAWQSPSQPPTAPGTRIEPYRPSVDHPWRRGFEARAAKRAREQAAVGA